MWFVGFAMNHSNVYIIIKFNTVMKFMKNKGLEVAGFARTAEAVIAVVMVIEDLSAVETVMLVAVVFVISSKVKIIYAVLIDLSIGNLN